MQGDSFTKKKTLNSDAKHKEAESRVRLKEVTKVNMINYK